MCLPALGGASRSNANRWLALHYQCFSSEALAEEKEEEGEAADGKVSIDSTISSHQQCRLPFVNRNHKKAAPVAHNDAFHPSTCNAHSLQLPFFAEIQALCQQGKLDKALQRLLFRDQLCSTRHVYLFLLKSCIQRQALPQAIQIHAHLVRHKADLTGVLGDYLVVTLAKCGGVELARQISVALPRRTVFSWTSMIAAYTESGQPLEALIMYRLMQKDGVEPDHYTFVSVLKACGSIPDLEQGKQLHLDAHRMGFAADVFVGNTLVSMYGKCGDVSKAENVFCELLVHNEVAYNAMLSVYVEQGLPGEALQLYRQMHEEKVSLNELTLGITIQACHVLAEKDDTSTKVMALEIGRALHHDAHRIGFDSDAFVGNMLVSMYGKCGMVADAEIVFRMLSSCDVKSWTQMLSVYVEQGEGGKALQFYRHMLVNGVHCDSYMFVAAFQACSALSLQKGEDLLLDKKPSVEKRVFEIGMALRSDAHGKGLASDVFVATALLTMYGKFGRLAEAEDVFDMLSQRSIVSWTAMFSAYIEEGQYHKALFLYKRMQEEFAPVDDVTIICILQACSETGNLDICTQLHFAIVSAGGYGKKVSLPATLVHAYASCASMVDAHAVFDELAQPDVVSWSACMAGYAGKGSCVASLRMLEAMQLASINPNEVTFASVLSACSHAGLALEGLEYFDSMGRDHGISRELKHYVNMTDLLGRAGDFKKLEDILSRMPMQADLTIWLSLLGMCVRHGNLELGKQAFKQASNLQPTEAVTYILMSNIYVDAQLESACGMNVLRQEENVGT